MSFNLKKAAALTSAAAIALSMTACGKDTTWGAKIDGLTLRAGLMIYFQSSAVSDAYSYVTDSQAKLLDTTIEDMPARDWINAKVEDEMREFAAVENKFDELGIVFQDSEDEKATLMADQWWEYLGAYYENLGIGKQSYLDAVLNSTKRSAIFNYYYGENGEKAVSDDEIKDYLKENYVRLKYIQMDLKDGEGNILKSDGKAEIKAMAEGYIERAKAGESFEAISKEYDDYYAALVAAAEEANKEEGSDTEGGSTEDGNITDLTIGGTDTNTDTGSEEEDAPDYGTIYSKDGTSPAASVMEKAAEMADGEYAIVEEYEVYYIVYKMDLFADPDYFENNRSSVLHTLKDEEFGEMLAGWISAQNVVINTDAVNRYKLEKHIEG